MSLILSRASDGNASVVELEPPQKVAGGFRRPPETICVDERLPVLVLPNPVIRLWTELEIRDPNVKIVA